MSPLKSLLLTFVLVAAACGDEAAELDRLIADAPASAPGKADYELSIVGRFVGFQTPIVDVTFDDDGSFERINLDLTRTVGTYRTGRVSGVRFVRFYSDADATVLLDEWELRVGKSLIILRRTGTNLTFTLTGAAPAVPADAAAPPWPTGKQVVSGVNESRGTPPDDTVVTRSASYKLRIFPSGDSVSISWIEPGASGGGYMSSGSATLMKTSSSTASYIESGTRSGYQGQFSVALDWISTHGKWRFTLSERSYKAETVGGPAGGWGGGVRIDQTFTGEL